LNATASSLGRWQKEGGTAIDAAARRLVDMTRARLSSVREPILLLTLCFEFGNNDYLPPQIGVVFSSDTKAFEQEPTRYGHDVSSLLNPTLQESLPFPTQTAFPFIEVRADQLPLTWPAAQLRKNALELTKRMNGLLSANEPPFLTMDLTGDATAHLDQLPEPQRRQIDRLST